MARSKVSGVYFQSIRGLLQQKVFRGGGSFVLVIVVDSFQFWHGSNSYMLSHLTPQYGMEGFCDSMFAATCLVIFAIYAVKSLL